MRKALIIFTVCLVIILVIEDEAYARVSGYRVVGRLLLIAGGVTLFCSLGMVDMRPYNYVIMGCLGGALAMYMVEWWREEAKEWQQNWAGNVHPILAVGNDRVMVGVGVCF